MANFRAHDVHQKEREPQDRVVEDQLSLLWNQKEVHKNVLLFATQVVHHHFETEALTPFGMRATNQRCDTITCTK